ncbi:hypothetical protein [Micromonospora sp. U21]|uniref:hypothetical protein n=1 Tax=Micromonospora sp. U21 TaxID=2824899 RepID=UPI001B3778C5|nr:hypothetical protein [Micromonospora sp. U21]MBQ0903423.1 hypothetical protein [Micromonospora sp. U21]
MCGVQRGEPVTENHRVLAPDRQHTQRHRGLRRGRQQVPDVVDGAATVEARHPQRPEASLVEFGRRVPDGRVRGAA